MGSAIAFMPASLRATVELKKRSGCEWEAQQFLQS
jgi:hypothetical protein